MNIDFLIGWLCGAAFTALAIDRGWFKSKRLIKETHRPTDKDPKI